MNQISLLAAGRIAAGAGTLLAPTLTGQLLGIGGPPAAHLSARMFGAREIALGVTALTLSGEQRRGALAVGVISDLGDIAAAVLGLRQKTVPAPQAVALGVLATGAVVIGVTERRS